MKRRSVIGSLAAGIGGIAGGIGLRPVNANAHGQVVNEHVPVISYPQKRPYPPDSGSHADIKVRAAAIMIHALNVQPCLVAVLDRLEWNSRGDIEFDLPMRQRVQIDDWDIGRRYYADAEKYKSIADTCWMVDGNRHSDLSFHVLQMVIAACLFNGENDKHAGAVRYLYENHGAKNCGIAGTRFTSSRSFGGCFRGETSCVSFRSLIHSLASVSNGIREDLDNLLVSHMRRSEEDIVDIDVAGFVRENMECGFSVVSSDGPIRGDSNPLDELFECVVKSTVPFSLGEDYRLGILCKEYEDRQPIGPLWYLASYKNLPMFLSSVTVHHYRSEHSSSTGFTVGCETQISHVDTIIGRVPCVRAKHFASGKSVSWF